MRNMTYIPLCVEISVNSNMLVEDTNELDSILEKVKYNLSFKCPQQTTHNPEPLRSNKIQHMFMNMKYLLNGVSCSIAY